MNEKLWELPSDRQHIFSLFFSILCMGIATGISFLYFYFLPATNANIALVYTLALALVSRHTTGYRYGIFCSLFAVVFVNFFFTYPFFEINFTLAGYPVTFLGMLALTLLISTMTSHLSRQSALIAERERQLAEAEKEKMRANLLRAISHDIRTPMTGIIGNSSTYLENQESLTDSAKTDIVSNIYREANWLLNMVENLLTITRIRGDALTVSTSEESVEEVLSEALQKLHKRYPDSQIKAHVPEELLLLPMDAILIEQVIINLLENAVVHSRCPAPIELKVTDHPDFVSFSIEDQGVGLSAERLENLFDGAPSSTSDGRKGMGIGLTICKTIIAAHHGTLTGRNKPGGGAEFIFTLPKRAEASPFPQGETRQS